MIRQRKTGAPTSWTRRATCSRGRPDPPTAGLIFVPGADTWHGFTRRPIVGVRRSLIVNYVKPEWRSRHELAFPNEAVVSANNE